MGNAEHIAAVRELAAKAKQRAYDGGTLRREELPMVALEISKEWAGVRATLPTHLDLSDADFSNTVFCGIDLEQATLTGADFSESVIFACKFSGSHLDGVCFDNSDITDAFFHGARLNGASFRRARMTLPSFTEANLTGACLDGATLHGARADNGTVLTAATFVGARVTRAKGHKGTGDFAKHLSAIQRRQLAGRAGCFIASAACGGAQSPEVRLLREFRDRVLMPTVAGAWLVDGYYRLSPAIAQRIEARPCLRSAVRALLVCPAARLAAIVLDRSSRA